jgi:hypothetical protein
MMRPFFHSRVVLLVLVAICAGACDETPAAPTPQPVTAPTPQPVTLSQFSLTPATVDAGAKSEGAVTLAAPAPPSGVEVRLSSSDGVAVVPASVIVAADATRAAFTVTTRLVAADTNVTISVLLAADKRAAILRVMAPIARPPTLQALEIEPAIVKGGENTRGTIRLTGPAVATMFVPLRSSNMLVVLPSCVVSSTLVPFCVPVQGGTSTATFTIATRPVTLDTVFDIVATLGDQVRAGQIRLTP